MGKLLLLDLDNTLADREAAFLAWARAKAAEWAPHDPRAVAYLIAQDDDGMRSRRELFSLIRARFGLKRPVEALVGDFRREFPLTMPAVGGDVVAHLRALRARGWNVAVVTNGDADVQAAKIERLGVSALLDACCISGELGIRKPDPRIFEVAATRCRNSLQGAWMVGDGEADIVGAHRAGIRSVWLHRGRTWPRPDVKPDHIAGGLVEALRLLHAGRPERGCS